jgi:hypothetical protein
MKAWKPGFAPFRGLAAVFALSLLASGCSMGFGMDSTGRVAEYKQIDDVVKTIRKGKTTRDELVAALGEPVNDMQLIEDTETLMFNDEEPFWKTGGVGQLFAGRTQVKTLMVSFKRGVVQTYSINKTWVNR